MEMLNKAVLNDLRDAGMDSPQAEVIAAHIPDWRQFVTKEDLKDVKQELKQELKHLKWALYAVVLLTVGLSDRAAALFEYVMQFR